MRISDWSSDVCSSDLQDTRQRVVGRFLGADDVGEGQRANPAEQEPGRKQDDVEPNHRALPFHRPHPGQTERSMGKRLPRGGVDVESGYYVPWTASRARAEERRGGKEGVRKCKI